MNHCNDWLILVFIFVVMVDTSVAEEHTIERKDTFYQEILMPGVTSLMKDAYLCTSLPLNSTEKWIIRYEPMISANRAHHMLLYGCSGVANIGNKGYWDCGHHQVCSGSRILYAWAKNAPATNLPNEVGFRIGGNFGVKYLVLQIHYAIPIPAGKKDFSGLKLLITNIRQKYKAGIYLLAMGYLLIPPHTDKFHGDLNCLVNLSDDIKLFAYRVHAHSLGSVITGYRYNQDTKKLDQIAKGNPQWPQSFYPTEEIYTIKPDDILHARCTYNSTLRRRRTFIGPTSADEMCNLYLMYYTDRENGPDNGYCGTEQFPDLSNALPVDSDEPLPKNDALQKQTIGENRNKNKEISYGNLFQSKKTTIVQKEEHQAQFDQGRIPVKPMPVKVATSDFTQFNSRYKEEGLLQRLDVIRNKTFKTQFHLEDNWGPKSYKLGQVTGVAVDSLGDVVIFHRGDRVWDSISFEGPYLRDKSKPILQPALLHLKKDSGAIMHEWGKNFFYMPHGLTVDNMDNLWVTDVGMHQVFKFNSGFGDGKPQITLGERFEPGNGKNRFCKPTGVAVMNNGSFFVSDGYCNSRIIHYSSNGRFIKEIDTSKESPMQYSFGSFSIPHSLTLAKSEKEICTADRENGRVLCFHIDNFALSRKFQFNEWGERLFAVVYSGDADNCLYAVNGPQFLRGVMKMMIFQVNFYSNTLDTSFSPHSQGFNNPHDIAISRNGNNLYVVEIGPNKIWKYSKELPQPSFSNRITLPDSDTVNSLDLYGNGWSSSSISYIILSLLAIPIVVLSVIAIFLRYRKKEYRNNYFGSLKSNLNEHQSRSGLKLLLKKHDGFERVPTTDSPHDSDSTDSEIEEFHSNVAKV